MRRKGLLKSGIDKLEAIMLANRSHYDQYTYGEVEDCKTTLCAAGFCYLRKLKGIAEFSADVDVPGFTTRCRDAGKKLLGIIEDETKGIQIFTMPEDWPDDLHEGFKAQRTHIGRVRFYINMLRTRALADGSLSKLPEEN
jgi:hypothetical protein